MKKVYSLAVAVAIGVSAMAQTTVEKNRGSNKLNYLPAVQTGTVKAYKSSSTPLLSEDFESVTTPNLPTGWTNVSSATDGGFFTGDYNDANAAGYWSVDDHTTFVMTNDDVCNCNKDHEYLTLPAQSFSGKTGLGLSFDVFFTIYSVEESAVEISTDGGVSWSTLYKIPGDDAWTPTTISLTAYNNAPSVMIRFHYMDNGEWGYGLAIDNLAIDALPENDIVLTDGYATMGNYNRDFYPVVPKTQVLPTVFSGEFTNAGTLDQTNVNFNVKVTQDGLTAVLSDLVPSTYNTTFSSGATDSVGMSTAYTPTDKGSYVAELSVTQTETDENPTNNLATYSFEVTDTVFGRDNGTQSYLLGTGMYTGAETEIEIASYFYITNATEATSISVYMDKSNTKLAGSDVMIVKVLNAADLSELYVSDLHDIVSSDLDTWVTLPLPAASTLDAGAEVYVSVQLISSGASGKNVYIGTDVTSYQDAGFVLIYIPGDQWYYVQDPGAPMLRLNLGNDFNSIAEVSNNGSLLLQNQPNPFNGETSIQYSLGNNAANVSVEVTDITGKAVMNVIEGSKLAGNHSLVLDATSLTAGTYFYTLNVDGSKLTSKMSVTE